MYVCICICIYIYIYINIYIYIYIICMYVRMGYIVLIVIQLDAMVAS